MSMIATSWLFVGLSFGILVGLLGRAPLIALKRRHRTSISVLKEEAKTLWLRRKLLIVLSTSSFALLCLNFMTMQQQAWEPTVVQTTQIESRQAVTAFAWTYHFQPEPGLRLWLRDARGRWHEHYPDGHDAKVFDVNGVGDVDGCRGSLSHASSEADFEVFVPDVGCRDMTALFRWNGGAWSVLGPMTVISSRPLSDG